MKKLLALILTLAAILSAVRLDGTASALQEKVLRLHVLAASDSESDQQLKLAARDAVMEFLAPLLEDCISREEAVIIAEENLPALAQLAADASGQQATAYIAREDFPRREYGEFALPAGEYTALRIELEEGAGQNWWCVVFPPLCTALGDDDDDTLALFDEGEVRLISGSGKIIKFRIVEWFSALKKALI